MSKRDSRIRWARFALYPQKEPWVGKSWGINETLDHSGQARSALPILQACRVAPRLPGWSDSWPASERQHMLTIGVISHLDAYFLQTTYHLFKGPQASIVRIAIRTGHCT